jgi:MoaA/NifB/PqqE/SkfB family radical SAM enzyme
VEPFICREHGLYAIASRSELEIGTFGHGSRLRVGGALADALGEQLRNRCLSATNQSRLSSLAAAVGASAENAIHALSSGTFRPAVPADFVQRGGYRMLWVELLARCNERCVHCYAESEPSRSDALDLETTLGVLSDAAELGFGTVQFTGGEPLLCPFLITAVAAARQRGLQVEVFTNGLLLDQPLLEALLGRQASLAFSLYADVAEVHDSVTGVGGSWRQTVDAIARSRSAGAELRIAVIALPQNHDRLVPTLRFAADLAGDPGAVGVDVARGVGRGRYDQSIVIPPEAYELACRVPKTESRSSAASGSACVSASGDVYPCIFMRWVTLGRIGKHGGLREILAAPIVRRSWLLAPEPELEEACRQRLTCAECQKAARLLALYCSHASQATQ